MIIYNVSELDHAPLHTQNNNILHDTSHYVYIYGVVSMLL